MRSVGLMLVMYVCIFVVVVVVAGVSLSNEKEIQVNNE